MEETLYSLLPSLITVIYYHNCLVRLIFKVRSSFAFTVILTLPRYLVKSLIIVLPYFPTGTMERYVIANECMLTFAKCGRRRTNCYCSNSGKIALSSTSNVRDKWIVCHLTSVTDWVALANCKFMTFMLCKTDFISVTM